MPRAAMACSTNTPVPCGAPAEEGGRCAAHAAQWEARRGSSAARGYGTVHQRARSRMLRRRAADWAAGRVGSPMLQCPRCLGPLPPAGPGAVPDEALHADHFGTRPPAAPDRLAHSACNVAAAARRRGPQA